jgi:K+-sensing histidine kinase KdpD
MFSYLLLYSIILIIFSLITSISLIFIIYEIFFHYISNINESILIFWEQIKAINKLNLLVYLLINITFFEIIFCYLKRKLIWKENNFNILNKIVNNKTLQLHTLVNNQKDFISLISHEIKWPIWTSIFQVSCLLDEIKDWNYSEKYIKREIWLLNKQLLKIWDLTNKLFSIEKYEIWKIILRKEKININDLLLYEVAILQKKNPNINFITNIDINIWFLELDKVQIIQVIDNLLNNAVKFSLKDNLKPQIIILTYLKEKSIFIEIEDNWQEFKNINISNLFEKHETWKWTSIWLWIWLYLCKKIINWHNWEIYAINSKKIWWAKFVIKLIWN